MDYAKDGRGKLVTASEAAAGLYYRCPECRADVFLKFGKKNVAHFAHRRGQGRPECELFHPSNYLAGPTPRYDIDAEANAPPIPPLLLSIELDPTPQSRLTGHRDWKLALTVPKAPDTHGSVRIDCGAGTPRLIALSKLALDAQTYPASLSAEDFGATWVSPEVHPRYKAAIEHRIAGLNRLFANVFVNSKEKQKPRANSLTWGGCYYLVWHDSWPIEIPASLASSQLAKRDGWSCSIVTLPDDEDADVRRWIEEECDLAISQPRRQWSIVYPPAIDIDSLGHLSVASNRQLLLATFAPPRQDDERGLLIATIGRSTASSLTRHGEQFFAIQHDTKSDAAVAVAWDGLTLPEITQTAAQDASSLLGTAFAFRSRSGAERYGCFLHQAQIEPLLQAVRQSELDISTISSPAGCVGAFKWRKAIGEEWQSIFLSIDRDGTRRETNEDAVQQANLILRDASFDVLFDFGALGSRYLEARGHRAVDAPQTLLPAAVRERLLWFCIVAKSYPHGTPLTALADDALLRHFKAAATPPFLIAHRRHLDALVRPASSLLGSA
ncbi:hypothetical protein IVB30_31010 [Bradyrhizobium sp. 200]|uniref:competence protein CoiA family protein n=1 Tax=Bradyrhizobium sp. 200 TaxID=2782665 RepID=UPI001FFEF549|nr:hypothetical protein [Bradyrhizobium sp. 200]UPJ47663.1 hypothetical protein IVB30_31010 [Bradyrhizobium sp. 200]